MTEPGEGWFPRRYPYTKHGTFPVSPRVVTDNGRKSVIEWPPPDSSVSVSDL